VEIKLQAPGKSEQILFGKVVRPEQRIPIALDLSAYDGQEIRIIFRVQNTASPSREYAAFQFPELWIKLKDNP